MFYQENEINELLICKLCNSKLIDPRVLNCGHTVCNKCIELIYNQQKKGIECLFCLRFHEMPKNGFPVNELISKLSDKKPKQIYRGEACECLKHRLDALHEKSEKLNYDFRTIPNKIREKSDLLRHEIDLITNELIELINKYRQDFLNEVYDYEKECTNKYINNYFEFNRKLEELFTQFNLFRNNSLSYLKKPNIDEAKIKQKNELSLEWLDKFKELDIILRRITFDDRILKFKFNNLDRIRPSIIGKLCFERDY